MDDLGASIYATAGAAMLVESLGIAALAFMCARRATGARRFIVFIALAIALTLLGDVHAVLIRMSAEYSPVDIWIDPILRLALTTLGFPVLAWVERRRAGPPAVVC